MRWNICQWMGTFVTELIRYGVFQERLQDWNNNNNNTQGHGTTPTPQTPFPRQNFKPKKI